MAQCFWCDGTGKYKKPLNEEEFDQVFDRYDKPGFFSMGECREKALKEVGFEIIECPHCHGTGNDCAMGENKKMSILKEKFGIKYYAELGIIDLFGLSLSKDEIKERIEYDKQDSYGSNRHSFYKPVDSADIDTMVNEIEDIIKNNTGERPVVVRFFSIPDFTYLGFNLCPIAKISNNGSTFVFSKDIGIFEYLNATNGYSISVKEI